MSLIDENHFYAKKSGDGIEVHISEATSGRGYSCIGCDRDMQAVRHKMQGYTDYFRHDAKYVNTGNKCTFSDHTYRKSIAINYLQSKKLIKVPSIFKFNADDIDAMPLLLEPPRTIEAYEAKTNLLFYENSNGEVVIAETMPENDCNLLFKPDIVFFDRTRRPILLIQIVLKFTITNETKANLRRIGINTLQITLPKESREAIINSLSQTGRSKWIYTNEQQFTEYVQPSSRNIDRGEPVDEFERRLHEESAICRINQIANLIRAIGKCYKSEQYLEVEKEISGEYLRTRRDIESNRKRREELEREFRIELNYQNQSQFETIAIEQSELAEEKIRISFYENGLESRYRTKAAELGSETKEFEGEESDIIRDEEGIKFKTTEIDLALEIAGGGIDKRKGVFEREFQLRIGEPARETDRVTTTIGSETDAIIGLQQGLDGIPEASEQLRGEIEERHAGEIYAIQQQEDRLPEDIERQGIALDERFTRLRAEVAETVERRDRSGTTSVSIGIKTLFDRRSKLADLEHIGRLLESVKKGTYKDWLR
jgi:hypothetical protein